MILEDAEPISKRVYGLALECSGLQQQSKHRKSTCAMESSTASSEVLTVNWFRKRLRYPERCFWGPCCKEKNGFMAYMKTYGGAKALQLVGDHKRNQPVHTGENLDCLPDLAGAIHTLHAVQIEDDLRTAWRKCKSLSMLTVSQIGITIKVVTLE